MRAIANRAQASAVAVLLAASGAGCAGAGGPDKAGGQGGVATLELGMPDRPGSQGSDSAQRFAREVRQRSGGKLRIRIVWQAHVRASGGYGPGSDQQVARLVRDGKLDLGLIPARAWDALGVTSLQALQAPFLITSDELSKSVAQSSIAPDMLAGLGRAGVVGLSLLPDGLRHPVGFDSPLRGPRDYQGRTLRVPLSRVSFELVRALGARPIDLDGAAFQTAVQGGRVTGAESSLELAGSNLPKLGTVTANVTFFAKLNTLVSDKDAFDKLSEHQRTTLREAAAATLQHIVTASASEPKAAAAACRGGVRLALATAPELAGLQRDARPVYARLERDAQTRAFIARVRELKARTNVSDAPLPRCDGQSPSETSATPADGAGTNQSVINGVYRYTLDEREMVQAGVDPGDAYQNYGLQTMTLRGGRFTSATRSKVGTSQCEGRYTVSGNLAEFTVTSQGCAGHWQFRWSKTTNGLRVTQVKSLPPGVTPQGQALDQMLYGSQPWKKIG